MFGVDTLDHAHLQRRSQPPCLIGQHVVPFVLSQLSADGDHVLGPNHQVDRPIAVDGLAGREMPGEHIGRVGVQRHGALRTTALNHRHPQGRNCVARRGHDAQHGHSGHDTDQGATPRPTAPDQRLDAHPHCRYAQRQQHRTAKPCDGGQRCVGLRQRGHRQGNPTERSVVANQLGDRQRCG